jgi:ribosome-associated protein
LTSLELARKAADILDQKKAADLCIIHIGELSAIGDYFVLATGTGTVQTRALADELDKRLSEEGVTPRRIEGYQSAAWILMDYHEVIVHIFVEETRKFYGLERLWSDAPVVDLA